jgi:hypothetical protein
VYFGTDWIGDASVESIVDTLPPELRRQLGIRYLASPELLMGHLHRRPDSARQEEGDEWVALVDDDAVEDDDLDASLEIDERSQWISFLTWIGVNAALRLVHFHDVEDDGTTWLTTENLARPKSPRFESLGSQWVEYTAELRAAISSRFGKADSRIPYLYEVHDLDLVEPILQHAGISGDAETATSLIVHLARHWHWFSGFVEAELALVPAGKKPRLRDNKKPTADELVHVGKNLWLHRLKQGSVCPTSWGPRRPGLAWFPSAEVDRRFRSRHRDAADLLPILRPAPGAPESDWRKAAGALGVRTELSPTSFALEDAQLLCERLSAIYSEEQPDIDATSLREVVRPVYRQLFELLSGKSGQESEGALVGTPLLAETTDGFRFLPSDEVLFFRTPGLRERLRLKGAVPTFVLEAEPNAVAPLRRLFGCNPVEDALSRTPDPGPVPFGDADLADLRHQLDDLSSSLIARVRIERNESSDGRTIREFLGAVVPTEFLTVTSLLRNEVVVDAQPVEYFVAPRQGQIPLSAFVVWEQSEHWPPSSQTAGRLAMALADTLGINLVEAFFGLFQAADETERRRLLMLAGASDQLADVQQEGADDPDPPKVSQPVAPSGDPDAAALPHSGQMPTSSTPASPPVLLRRFEDLTISGTPLLLHQRRSDGTDGDVMDPAEADEGGVGAGLGGTRQGRRSAAGTDLAALDALGMDIAIAYEVMRLQSSGHDTASLLNDGISQGHSYVVDVHSPSAIRAAEEVSTSFAEILTDLEASGISRLYPGCDLITVRNGEVDRMIELKSSMVDARVQEMSWNEWKSAAGPCRERFWLYLVGNLRGDIAGTPFVRCIRDPFGSLLSEQMTHTQRLRRVQLRVQEFSHAEHLDLGLSPSVNESPDGGQGP